MRYELIPHTADIGIRVTNKTMSGLFEDAAFALFDILTDIKEIRNEFNPSISVSAVDNEELLNEFLNKLLTEFTVYNNLISKVKVEAIEAKGDKIYLSATISGEAFNPKRHLIKTEIKAVTFNDIYVKKTAAGYEAQVIFDV
jgi:SHS2 domain-containing protein